MYFSDFISALEKSDDVIFQAVTGLTRSDFNVLLIVFSNDKDSTRKLNDTDKLYAILISKKWSLEGSEIGTIILSSPTSNRKRDGDKFLTAVGDRLNRVCQTPTFPLPLREKIKRLSDGIKIPIKSLEEIFDKVEKIKANEKQTVASPLDYTTPKKGNFVNIGFPLPFPPTNQYPSPPLPSDMQKKTVDEKDENTESIPTDIPYKNDNFLLLESIPNGSRYILGVPALNSSGDIYHTLTYLAASLAFRHNITPVVYLYDTKETELQADRAIGFSRLFGFNTFSKVHVPTACYQDNTRTSNLRKYVSGLQKIPHYLLDQKITTLLLAKLFDYVGFKRTTDLLRSVLRELLQAARNNHKKEMDLINTWVESEVARIKKAAQGRKIVIFSKRTASGANPHHDFGREMTNDLKDVLKRNAVFYWFLIADSKREYQADNETLLFNDLKASVGPEFDTQGFFKLRHMLLLMRLHSDLPNLVGIAGNTSGTLDIASFLGLQVYSFHTFSGNRGNIYLGDQDYRILLQNSFLSVGLPISRTGDGLVDRGASSFESWVKSNGTKQILPSLPGRSIGILFKSKTEIQLKYKTHNDRIAFSGALTWPLKENERRDLSRSPKLKKIDSEPRFVACKHFDEQDDKLRKIIDKDAPQVQSRHDIFALTTSKSPPNVDPNVFDSLDSYVKDSVGSFNKGLFFSNAGRPKTETEKTSTHNIQGATNDNIKNAFSARNEHSHKYSEADIACVIQQYKNLPEFRECVILDVISDFENNSPTQRLAQIDHLTTKNICGIFNIGNWHWTTFYILNSLGSPPILLYKDSMGNEASKTLIEAITTVFGEDIIVKYNTKKEQEDETSCGIFALKNMQIIASKLNGNQKLAYVATFESNTDFCKQTEADVLRINEFSEKRILGAYASIVDTALDSQMREPIRKNHQSEAEQIQAKLTKEMADNKVLPLPSIIILDVNKKISDFVDSNIIGIEIFVPRDAITEQGYHYQYRLWIKGIDEKHIISTFNLSPKMYKITNQKEHSYMIDIDSDSLNLEKSQPIPMVMPKLELEIPHLYSNLGISHNFGNQQLVQDVLRRNGYVINLPAQQQTQATEYPTTPNVTLTIDSSREKAVSSLPVDLLFAAIESLNFLEVEKIIQQHHVTSIRDLKTSTGVTLLEFLAIKIDDSDIREQVQGCIIKSIQANNKNIPLKTQAESSPTSPVHIWTPLAEAKKETKLTIPQASAASSNKTIGNGI